MRPLITLLSDFGLQDPYVGVMKGVIYSHCSEALLVDLTHWVAPQDIWQGAIQLERSVPHFPPGTIHLAVVDPGVGSQREAVVVVGKEATYVGPNNGLFTLALRHDKVRNVYRIQPGLQTPDQPSATFHGRDLFAHVAGRLAAGVQPSQVGPPLTTPLIELPLEDLAQRVLTVDRFGNVQLGLHRDQYQSSLVHVEVLGHQLPFHLTYSQVPPGQLLCLWNSDGYLELALNGGSAAQLLDLQPGQRLDYRLGTQARDLQSQQ